MFSIIKFFIKAAIVIVLLYLAMHLDYNGRKLGTYVAEAFKSYKVQETVATVEKAVHIKDKSKIKQTFGANAQKHKAMSEITDKERKELEELME